jgi:hypothetical protein
MAARAGGRLVRKTNNFRREFIGTPAVGNDAVIEHLQMGFPNGQRKPALSGCLPRRIRARLSPIVESRLTAARVRRRNTDICHPQLVLDLMMSFFLGSAAYRVNSW